MDQRSRRTLGMPQVLTSGTYVWFAYGTVAVVDDQTYLTPPGPQPPNGSLTAGRTCTGNLQRGLPERRIRRHCGWRPPHRPCLPDRPVGALRRQAGAGMSELYEYWNAHYLAAARTRSLRSLDATSWQSAGSSPTSTAPPTAATGRSSTATTTCRYSTRLTTGSPPTWNRAHHSPAMACA